MQGPQQPCEGLSDEGGGFARGPPRQQQACVAFMHPQHGLPRGAEQHQIGFPMAWGPAVARGGGPFSQGAPAVDVGDDRRAPLPAEPARDLLWRPARFEPGEHLGG